MFPSRLHTPRRFWPGPAKPGREPVVPMINVVFLLLIFFLLAAQFADPGGTGRSKLAVDRPAEMQRVLVLAPSGMVTFGTLRGEEAIRAAASAGMVRLQTDRQTQAALLARLLSRLAEAGAGRVDLVTTGEGTE